MNSSNKFAQTFVDSFSNIYLIPTQAVSTADEAAVQDMVVLTMKVAHPSQSAISLK